MFKPVPENQSVAETIREVADALKEKGYNPIDQLAGYLLSAEGPAFLAGDRKHSGTQRFTIC